MLIALPRGCDLRHDDIDALFVNIDKPDRGTLTGKAQCDPYRKLP
jgi:hypothetical protein